MIVKRLNTELYHHGIKGQEWGVKNGPPYPLNSKKEFKNVKKTYRKILSGGPHEYAKSSDAVRQMSESEPVKTASKNFYKSAKDLDDYIKKYAKQHDAEIKKKAFGYLREDNKKYDWGYSEFELTDEDSLNERIHKRGHKDTYYNDALYESIKNDQKYKKLEDDLKKSNKAYQAESIKAAEKILGKYKDRKINSLITGNIDAKRYVAKAIDWYSKEDIYDYDYVTSLTDERGITLR